MNKRARLFSRSNYSTGTTEWFFKSREGINGPFHSEHAAVWALDEYVRQIAASREAGKKSSHSEAMVSETAGQPLPVGYRNTRLN
jgi:hypothetical protein